MIVSILFVLLTLYLMLNEYIRRQEDNIKLLFILGTTKNSLIKIYMRQILFISFIGMALPLIIGILLSISFFANSGYYIKQNIFSISVYVTVVLIELFAFLTPVRVGLHRILKSLGGQENERY